MNYDTHNQVNIGLLDLLGRLHVQTLERLGGLGALLTLDLPALEVESRVLQLVCVELATLSAPRCREVVTHS